MVVLCQNHVYGISSFFDLNPRTVRKKVLPVFFEPGIVKNRCHYNQHCFCTWAIHEGAVIIMHTLCGTPY